MTTSPLTGPPEDRAVETTSGLDYTQQQNMAIFFDLQQNVEQQRQAIAAQRRADERMPQAEEEPQPPADGGAGGSAAGVAPTAQPQEQAVEFDGDDRMCAICRDEFVHGDRVVRLRCRHILHRQCNIQLLENTDSDIVLCPACRGRADAIAEFRFIGQAPEAPAGWGAAGLSPELLAQAAQPQDDGAGGRAAGAAPAAVPIHTPRRAASPVPSPLPTTPAQPIQLQTPPSAASFQSALSVQHPPDSYQT